MLLTITEDDGIKKNLEAVRAFLRNEDGFRVPVRLH